ncbi:MAG: DUF3618 domain-containing protein [Solirubrobacterales bacterium]
MADPAQVEREIEQTRDELADTAGALAAKTDVKQAVKSRPVIPLAVAGAALAAAVIVWAVRR